MESCFYETIHETKFGRNKDMKAKVRTFNGTTSPEVTQRETDHRKLAREAAAEGFVLLENKDHFLPLAKGSKVGLYGAGASYVVV